MQKSKLTDFTNGWIVGNFNPSIIKTDQFEFALKKYQAGDVENKHYHKIAKEITVVASGVFIMNNHSLKEGDILTLEPGELGEFQCIKDGYTAVIKIPGASNDKYII
ncbi:MAG: hypothetical protein WC415_00250 [Patescibacteria group bacterium]|jgi:quercetin dioxygenase-like cupin family protein